MELSAQSLRISLHGSGDHSGDIWEGFKSSTHRVASPARFRRPTG